MSDQRKSRFPVKLAMLSVIALTSYIHGLRLVDISETPSSQRPWKIILSGQVSTETASNEDWLSQLAK